MTERIHIKNLKNHIGKEVSLSGWVDIRRDHGKLIFVDLRDTSGKIQMVILPNHKEAHATASTIRNEWVIAVKGKVNRRPEKMVKKDAENGDLELEVLSMDVLNQADTPAFDLSTAGYEVNEEVRLSHRYLDLRRERLQKNIKMRHKVVKLIRDYLGSEEKDGGYGFIEIETPMLTKSTPEGSRDYVVPSRIEKGKFYALPQSPQQYKQLLMAAGMERYFQIARCMRDEDTRGDRQPEFTQLDLEMSFVEREEVMALNEALLIEIVTKLFPEKKIQALPFPRLTYKEAMEKYGSDKPDIRADKNNQNLLAFCWIVDFPFFEKTEKTPGNAENSWTFTHNPFSAPQSQYMDWLMEGKEGKHIGEILTSQYDITLNGFEIGGGSIRNHNASAFTKVMEIIGHSREDIEKNFGHMIKAFKSGTPPHGGIAWGIDRLMAILMNEPNIREVIAFPKTGEGRDLMMNAPAEISDTQLQELALKIKL